MVGSVHKVNALCNTLCTGKLNCVFVRTQAVMQLDFTVKGLVTVESQ